MAMRLPVYSLSVDPRGSEKLGELAANAFGAKQLSLEEEDGRIIGRWDSLVIEYDRASGGIWAADERRLWNPAQRPSLITPRRANARAQDLFKKVEVGPGLDGDPFALVELGPGRTNLASRRRGKRSSLKLEVQAR